MDVFPFFALLFVSGCGQQQKQQQQKQQTTAETTTVAVTVLFPTPVSPRRRLESCRFYRDTGMQLDIFTLIYYDDANSRLKVTEAFKISFRL